MCAGSSFGNRRVLGDTGSFGIRWNDKLGAPLQHGDAETDLVRDRPWTSAGSQGGSDWGVVQGSHGEFARIFGVLQHAKLFELRVLLSVVFGRSDSDVQRVVLLHGETFGAVPGERNFSVRLALDGRDAADGAVHALHVLQRDSGGFEGFFADFA